MQDIYKEDPNEPMYFEVCRKAKVISEELLEESKNMRELFSMTLNKQKSDLAAGFLENHLARELDIRFESLLNDCFLMHKKRNEEIES